MGAFEFDNDDRTPTTTRASTQPTTRATTGTALKLSVSWVMTFTAVLLANLITAAVLVLVTRWYVVNALAQMKHDLAKNTPAQVRP